MEVLPGIHKVGPVLGANVWLLVGQELTLIDTGLPGNASAILRYIRSLGRREEELRTILLTHAHPDHTGSAAALRETTGARVLAHRGDVKLVGGIPTVEYLGIFGRLPQGIPFLGRVPVDGYLEDGQVLPALGSLRVLHAPGHTPGSVCLLLEPLGVLFPGDLVVNRGNSIGPPVFYPKSDRKAYQRSLERVAALEFPVVCFSHGGFSLEGGARRFRRLARWLQGAPPWKQVLSTLPAFLRPGLRRAWDEEP